MFGVFENYIFKHFRHANLTTLCKTSLITVSSLKVIIWSDIKIRNTIEIDCKSDLKKQNKTKQNKTKKN